ncbi:MAG: LysE family transporter [Bdellovibrionales bacterium]|nr:LysE family transporter [Bdellovibrionales bacterium]
MFASLFFGFTFGFFGAVPVAGPVSAIILRFGLKKQTRKGRAVAAGAALAEAFYVFLAFFGFNLLLDSVPYLQSISKYLTSIILGALGIYFMVSKSASSTQGGTPTEITGKKSAFGVGFGISILNPTLIATWSTVIASLYSYRLFPYSITHALLFSVGV